MAAILFLIATLALASEVQASLQLIAGYLPETVVTDHNAIDLDLQAIQFSLAGETDASFVTARDIYQYGAFSKSVATLSLIEPLTGPLKKGAKVVGRGEVGDVSGTIYENYDADEQVIRVQYTASRFQSNYLECQVGKNPDPNTVGCFLPTGTLDIEGLGGKTEYLYDPLTGNTNERTIQGFSTNSGELMYNCSSINCPYKTYEKFYNYYGRFDYADHWIMSAFDATTTSLTRGNANFGEYGYSGRAEILKKGMAYMNIWMYVIRELEDALDDCTSGCDVNDNCNDDAVQAWDEAVAFYTGSLELQDGSGDGNLIYSLADKRCVDFKTCGDLADDLYGTSHVNIEVFREFRDGLLNTQNGLCARARLNKERIEEMMVVPLIQGTLRYAYIQGVQGVTTESAEAEGAAFAASVLPLVHACDEDDAHAIYENMRVGHDFAVNFREVKSAFERNYACLNIRCRDVGGFYNDGFGKYFEGAAPCDSAFAIGNGLAVTLLSGLVICIALLF